MKTYYYLILFIAFLPSCSSSQSGNAIQTKVAGTVAALITPTNISTLVPPSTPDSTRTPTFTRVPIETQTPKLTAIPTYSQPVVLQEFSGVGEAVSDNFQLPSCWKAVFHWKILAGDSGFVFFTLTMHNKDTSDEVGVVNLFLVSVSAEGVIGASHQPLEGGEYYFSTIGSDSTWTVQVECQDGVAPIATGSMDVQGAGMTVTDNYELPACQKSVFSWSFESEPFGASIMDLKICDFEDCNDLVSEGGTSATATQTGETVYALTGDTYFLVATGFTDTPWSIHWECRDE